MTDTALTLPTYPHVGAGVICISVLIALARKLRRPTRDNASKVATLLTDQLRADLGFENPPLRPVSRFQGFETETCIVKQCPEALQLHLIRGIER